MSAYPYTIDNGHGERLTFLGCPVRNGIKYLAVENNVSPGAGPPMHVHFKQEESITVIEGVMAIQLKGGDVKYLEPGETCSFKPGIMHKFWNAGHTMLRCSGEVWPADNLEYFLTEIYKSTSINKGRPSAFDAAWLLNRFKDEFDMDLPLPVKKVVFPIVLFTGRLLGRHKKYNS